LNNRSCSDLHKSAWGERLSGFGRKKSAKYPQEKRFIEPSYIHKAFFQAKKRFPARILNALMISVLQGVNILILQGVIILILQGVIILTNNEREDFRTPSMAIVRELDRRARLGFLESPSKDGLEKKIQASDAALQKLAIALYSAAIPVHARSKPAQFHVNTGACHSREFVPSEYCGRVVRVLNYLVKQLTLRVTLQTRPFRSPQGSSFSTTQSSATPSTLRTRKPPMRWLSSTLNEVV
jgi:hypothetical protein